jgi:hypothetical protein
MLGDSGTLAVWAGVLLVSARLFRGAGSDFSLKYRFASRANQVSPVTHNPVTIAVEVSIPPATSMMKSARKIAAKNP